MSAYDSDPRVVVNDDGTVTATVSTSDGPVPVIYDPADELYPGQIDESIRSLIGDPQS